MTREEAKVIFEDLRERKISLSDLSVNEQEEICDMAISALSTDGEYIKKEEAISKILIEFVAREEKGNVICACAEAKQTCADILDGLPTYSFPDSAENKGEWIDKGNGSYVCSNCKTEWTTSQIEKMCFCPTCGNPKVIGG